MDNKTIDSKTTDNTFDAIVIGSGCGGMMSAMLLQEKLNKKVLLIEKNYSLGGLTHSFVRRVGDVKYRWNSGVHYVGNIYTKEELENSNEDDMYDISNFVNCKSFLDYITNFNIQYKRLPEDYDCIIQSGKKYFACSGLDNFIKRFTEYFPSQKDAITKFVDDMIVANSVFNRSYFASSIQGHTGDAFTEFSNLEYLNMTVKEYFDANFDNEELKSALSYMWGNFGVPPSVCPFGFFSIINLHYMVKGAYYPDADRMSHYFYDKFTKLGGKVLVNSEVLEIIVQDNVAKSVKLASGESLYADYIISNAGTKNTYQKLLKDVDLKGHHRFKDFRDSVLFVDIFIGLKDNPEEVFGVKGENYWCEMSDDKARMKDLDHGLSLIDGYFLSFGSLHQPMQDSYYDGYSHNCQLIGIIDDTSYFSKIKDKRPYHGDNNYKKLKDAIFEELVKRVCLTFPNFREQIAYYEVSTSKTQEYFGGFEKGSSYDLLHTKEKFLSTSTLTPIKNLYMSGSHALCLGVMGALMGGIYPAIPIMCAESSISTDEAFMDLMMYLQDYDTKI